VWAGVLSGVRFDGESRVVWEQESSFYINVNEWTYIQTSVLIITSLCRRTPFLRVFGYFDKERNHEIKHDFATADVKMHFAEVVEADTTVDLLSPILFRA